MGHRGDLLCNDAPVIDWQIGQVPCRTYPVDIVCNGIEYLPLCKRTVIRDVIDVARGLLMIGSQQETLHHIAHIAKWQRVVSPPNYHPLATFIRWAMRPKCNRSPGPKK